MSKEVMQQALEALEELAPSGAYKVGNQWLANDPDDGRVTDVREFESAFIAIDALKEALSSQGCENITQQGEPVAWLSVDSIGERYLCFSRPNDGDKVLPLYTSAPQYKGKK